MQAKQKKVSMTHNHQSVLEPAISPLSIPPPPGDISPPPISPPPISPPPPTSLSIVQGCWVFSGIDQLSLEEEAFILEEEVFIFGSSHLSLSLFLWIGRWFTFF